MTTDDNTNKRMTQKMLILFFGILLINFTSATTIIAGDCLQVDLSELESLDNVVYDVVGNSSNLHGLTIELNGTMADVCTELNYKEDSFTLIFIDDTTKEVVKEVHVGGGGGRGGGSSGTRTIYKDRNITNYVTEYVDNETIKYEDKEVEKIITKIPWWIYSIWAIPIIFGLFCVYMFIRNIIFNRAERRYEKE